MMNRREFAGSALAAIAALSLPCTAFAKPPLQKIADREWFGPHHSEFDNNDAMFATAQKMFGTLWFGNERPRLILSPSRVVGRMWHAIIPMQRFKIERPALYSCRCQAECNAATRGFIFVGATWIANDHLTDEIVFLNDSYPRMEGEQAWKKLNGWYRASRLILDDPFGDECFRKMQSS